MYCRRRALLAAFAVLVCGGCSRRPATRPIERVAILRFENLSGDVSADWVGRALSEVVSGALSDVPGMAVVPAGRMHALNATLGVRPISAPGISSERTMALAAGANRLGYGEYAFVKGRLETRLTLGDPATGKMVRVVTASAAAGDVIGAGTTLARGLSDRASAYGPRSVPALKAWVEAMEPVDPAAVPAALARCLAADADFGPAYLALAQWKAQHQDRTGATGLLGVGLARGDRIPRRDRERMQFELASLRGDAAGRQRALQELTRLDPLDPTGWRALGQAAFMRREFKAAIEAWQKSIAIEDDPATENQLAYAAAYAGDLETAVQALHRYQAVRPGDPNPLDSLGDVHLITGRLRQAEGFYREVSAKAPNFLNNGDYFKAAMARLMTGDVPGADALAKQYADARAAAHDPTADLHRAEWSWISGRRKAGYQQLKDFARRAETGGQRDLAARAYAELALWSLLEGDRTSAAQMANESAPLAGPSSIGLSILARFLAQPPTSAEEWTNRAARQFPSGVPSSLRDLALAYALLLDRQFPAAAVALKRIYEGTNPNAEEGVSILLAWSLLETDRVQEAAPLLKSNPVPPSTGVGATMGFYFPRLYEIRAMAAGKAGRSDEARTDRELYQRLSGAESK